jgi:hypothetical protein
MALITALLALAGGVMLNTGPGYRWIGYRLMLIVHEGGHAVATVLSNHGRVSGIELHTSANSARLGYGGITHSVVYGSRASVFVSAAGYPAPAVLGLTVLALAHHQHTKGALAALVASLTVMLFLIRNLFGAFLVFLVGAVLYLVFLNGSTAVQTVVVGAFGWTLLLSATLETGKLLRQGTTTGDVGDLAVLTGVRPAAWSALFLVLTASATGYALWQTFATWI